MSEVGVEGLEKVVQNTARAYGQLSLNSLRFDGSRGRCGVLVHMHLRGECGLVGRDEYCKEGGLKFDAFESRQVKGSVEPVLKSQWGFERRKFA
jgi:hypothetical protein